MECIFCKIASGLMPAKIIYQDDTIIAFDDIYPCAPIHKLIIPLKHISTLNDLSLEDKALVGHIIYTAKHLASDLGIAEDGYRTLINCNRYGGQTVFHLHLHLMAGRQMQWPPG